MPEDKPNEDWLAQFRRDVDDALPEPPAPPSTAAQNAHAAFEIWWKAEQDPLLEKPPRFTLPAPEASPVSLNALTEKIQSLAEEKAGLTQALEKALREAAELRADHSRVSGTLAEFETKMSRAREAYETHIAKLESQVKLLDEQSKSLRGDKSFLEGAFTRLEDRNKALENETRSLIERAASAERAQLELRRQATDLQADLGQTRIEDAAKRGALEELRKQASVYQERLVLSKELTDSDVNLLRQELRDFLAKVKRINEENKP